MVYFHSRPAYTSFEAQSRQEKPWFKLYAKAKQVPERLFLFAPNLDVGC